MQKEMDECNRMKERAGTLLDALAGEKQKWRVASRVVNTKFESLEGDCLLGAALMIYLAQFTHKFRDKYLQKWLDVIDKCEKLKMSDDWDFSKLFAEQILIKEWIINKLPND
jgi:hypothetical protein